MSVAVCSIAFAACGGRVLESGAGASDGGAGGDGAFGGYAGSDDLRALPAHDLSRDVLPARAISRDAARTVLSGVQRRQLRGSGLCAGSLRARLRSGHPGGRVLSRLHREHRRRVGQPVQQRRLPTDGGQPDRTNRRDQVHDCRGLHHGVLEHQLPDGLLDRRQLQHRGRATQSHSIEPELHRLLSPGRLLPAVAVGRMHQRLVRRRHAAIGSSSVPRCPTG